LTDKVVSIVEQGLQGIALQKLTRPPVPFETPNEDLAIFAVRVYAYSLIAHIRTVLAGVIVLDAAGNSPSLRLLCRHVFEWTAQAAFVAENVSKHVKVGQWARVFRIVSVLIAPMIGSADTATSMVPMRFNSTVRRGFD
jgi:hypothetical protein